MGSPGNHLALEGGVKGNVGNRGEVFGSGRRCTTTMLGEHRIFV